MLKTKLGESIRKTDSELTSGARMFELRNDIAANMGAHWNVNSNVFMSRLSISRILYLNMLYQHIVDVPGIICEFGVQWGASLSVLANLRGIHEPYNYSRKIVGFDTFQGFSKTHELDGKVVSEGDYSTMVDYQHCLDEIMSLHELGSPLPHIKKYELVAGDASKSFPTWIENNPQTVISMAIFDMDIYHPTKEVLMQVLPRLVRGSVLVFDELNCPQFPGETLAVIETLGLNNLKLKRDPNQPFCAWAVFGE
ncbi:hypothetical protein K4H28_07360 [Deefgea tanakiae]|uniref:Crotonobetainyl-CoA--carnitine CoA-transferase n=1 Tax=Deefgea tanakiae TaxID=2865840 RepID=A0ABX8ZEB7_9NEIS|nr:TylF/MycF/NovP-related O-methyltransferase [Deefgea tanakiae]QZA79204.1 hypothetical protein K4H28_07360 [Deefgea tanakiae]